MADRVSLGTFRCVRGATVEKCQSQNIRSLKCVIVMLSFVVVLRFAQG